MKAHNTTCECGRTFRKAPSSKLRRCKVCRVGKQGVRPGKEKQSRVCPKCAGRKSRRARMCRVCFVRILETGTANWEGNDA